MNMISGPNSPKQARPGMSSPCKVMPVAGFKNNLPMTTGRANPSSRLKPKTFPTCCIPGSTQMGSY